MEDTSDALEDIVRRDWGRLLSALIGQVGSFQLAEDSLQDAITAALDAWPKTGIPEAPGSWLLKTARRRAIDRVRRSETRARNAPDLTYLQAQEQHAMDRAEDIPDERLRLIFTACHPALDQQARVALTLRTLCGLNTSEIARAFLVSDTAMGQRLVRAKTKIRAAGIPYAVPAREDWAERLQSVLTVIYLIYNEGYAAHSEERSHKHDLCTEALHLGALLDGLRPADPEIEGLRALMTLSHARRAARFDAAGRMVSLQDQNRDRWHRDEIATGQGLLRRALLRGQVGVFQLQAAIQAVHSDAVSHDATDWQEIVMLYNHLAILNGNPVVLLNRAVAVSYCDGAEAGLAALDALSTDLAQYQPFHAALADMMHRAGQDSLPAYSAALALTKNPAERAFLSERRDQAKKEAEQCSAQVQQGG